MPISAANSFWISLLFIISLFNLVILVLSYYPNIRDWVTYSIIRIFRIFAREKMGFPKEKIINRVIEVRKDICGSRRGAQKTFAISVLQMKYSTYRDYESHVVDLDFLQLLADRFGYRIEWLLLGQKPKKKDLPAK